MGFPDSTSGKKQNKQTTKKNLPPYAGDIRDAGSIPGLGRSSEGGHGNQLQYSYLENSIDRQAWKATVHKVEKKSKKLDTTEVT